jgi:ABC-2 type transport system ATP-binding protein
LLALQNIVKQFDKYKANDGISFEIPSSSVFGLLGPNGAGKTTLIRVITGITAPDSGSVMLDGKPFKAEDRSTIGYMPEERGLYKKMKVGEQLIYLAQLKGLSKQDARKSIKDWLVKFEIENWWDKKVEELSKGMQQKIQFIATVVHKPQLVILDEPFSGLDPINADLIIKEIFELKNNGATIVFSTHRMEQVEELCKSIVLINKGKNILEGNVTELRKQFKDDQYRVEYEGELHPSFAESYQIINLGENIIQVQINKHESANELLKKFIESGLTIVNFQEMLPSLHDIFVKRVKEFNSSL